MNFILATKDGKKFVTFYAHADKAFFTENTKLAMRFRTRSEANRFGMTMMKGEYVVMKLEGK